MDFPLWIKLGLQGASTYLPFVVAGSFLFRIVKFPDLGIEGAYAVGAASASLMVSHGYNIYVALSVSFISATIMGSITASLFLFARINAILCGIITTLAGYTICWLVLGGKASQPIAITTSEVSNFYIGIGIALLLSVALSTRWGLVARMAAEKPLLLSHIGISPSVPIGLQLIIGNGLIGFAGACAVFNAGNTTLSIGSEKLFLLLTTVSLGEGLLALLVHAWSLAKVCLLQSTASPPPLRTGAISKRLASSWRLLLAVTGFGAMKVLAAAVLGSFVYWLSWEATVQIFHANEWTKLLLGILVAVFMVFVIKKGDKWQTLPAWEFHGLREW